MSRVFEVKITTYTRVVAESEADARSFAEALLDTVDTEGVTVDGELHAFSCDDPDVVETDEPEEDKEDQ